VKGELLTAEEMGAAEKAAIAEGVPESMLMERAGQGVADVILKMFAPCQTVVVCGPGKNGGDGKVVARLLKEKGWPVQVITAADLSTHENLEQILCEIKQSIEQAELIVDALLGTGLSRPIEGYIRMLVDVINASLKPVVAIDIPSGIDTNSGNCWGDAIRATLKILEFLTVSCLLFSFV
jgi:hydroxyethylthiazole kinase-like uncharacterized protein yjeF